MSDPSPHPRPRRWLRWTGEALLVLAVFAATHWWLTRDMAGGRAPPLVGLLADGSAYQLQSGDRATLVHFWATWCPICRLEHDSIAAIAADRPVVSVAIHSGGIGEVADYLHEQGLTFPVVVDESGDLAALWGVGGVPASFIVDRDGEIRHVTRGYTTEWGLRLRLWLAD